MRHTRKLLNRQIVRAMLGSAHKKCSRIKRVIVGKMKIFSSLKFELLGNPIGADKQDLTMSHNRRNKK